MPITVVPSLSKHHRHAQASFLEYFKEMPWIALPFKERETKAKLSSKFKVNGIPTLVVLDGQTGEVITSDGRAAVDEDPEGSEFPWRPKSVAEVRRGVRH